ncbi:MAG TPA: protein kinase [Pyrinomonadaceae bacterium]|jgi:Tol biopolymer transport system component
MQAERWKQVDELLDAALELEHAERAALLDRACATDPDLRREVESLLAAHDRAGHFIEEQAFEVAARGLVHEHEAAGSLISDDAVPRSLGPYRVLSLLAAGGMGEVYLARDTRLGRPVALKLLPTEYTGDPERIRRFEREARAASALNHPNIVTIYEIGQEDGVYFIATEYVEGRTLRQVLAHARPSLDESIALACQIADALAAAHVAGIVHRDVKPENVMVRPDGYVKVLDFGIAKLTEQSSPDDASEHASALLQTATGTVMGTAAYMSPEQSLGQEVDQRTDIFSLGVVLYELFTGRHPFRGSTPAATFDALLNREPTPLCGHDSGLPDELERIVCRALEKERERRYQNVSELGVDLRGVERNLSTAPSLAGQSRVTRTPASRAGRASPRLARGLLMRQALASLLLVAIVGTVAFFAWRRAAPEVESVASSPSRSFNFVQLTDQPGVECFPSLSPDGSLVAYAARGSGNWDIYLQRAGEKTAANLTQSSLSDETQPALSPDGRSLALRSERERGGLYLMSLVGGATRRLTDFGYHPSWSPDGREIAFATHDISDPNARRLDQSITWVVNVETGLKRQLTDGRSDAAQPSWSPTGARVAYWGKNPNAQRDIWTIPAQGGEPVAVTNDAAFDWNPVWSPDGKYIYFSSDRGGSMNLWRVPLEEQTGRVTGAPEPLTTPSAYAQHVAFSRDGRRAAYASLVSSTNISKVAFNPYKETLAGQPVAVTRGTRHASTPNLSPDGEWIVYSSMGEKQEDIFVIDRDGASAPRQLTNDVHKDRGPVWSPDGARIAFYSGRSGKYELWTIRADGSDLRQLTFTEGESVAYPVWSPDGARLAYSRPTESSSVIETGKTWAEQTPWRIPVSTDRRIDLFWASSWSPDGRKLAGWIGSLSGQTGIVVYNFETSRFERITEYGSFPVWLRDGRRLVFSHENKLHLVNVETGKAHVIFQPDANVISGKAISTDNRTILYSLTSTEADIWMLDIE